MTTTIAGRLLELGLDLPEATPPRASYLPAREWGSVLYVSGQIAKQGNAVPPQFVGKVGSTVSLDDAREAARLCALNLIAQVAAVVKGDIDRVKGVLRLRGFVNATPDFAAHPAVIDAASDLLVEVFGERGRHARTAVGAGSLPQNVAVEIDADIRV
jgi:enamine deaminase RidA (YjgF/YER057c/UK114 family)